jgi:hypothetical protein
LEEEGVGQDFNLETFKYKAGVVFSNSVDKFVMLGYFCTLEHGSSSDIPGTEVPTFSILIWV